MLLEETHHYKLTVDEHEHVYITIVNQGASLKNVDQSLKKLPRVKLTNFAALKNAVSTPSEEPIEIGVLLPEYEFSMAHDEMSATVTFFDNPENTDEYIEKFREDMNHFFKEHAISFGIKEVDLYQVRKGHTVFIAQGTSPEKGRDAEITYIELPDKKPVLSDESDGRVNYFDMNFILEVKEDDWLAEKTLPKNGVPGRTITNRSIAAEKGDDFAFQYDPSSAYEVSKENKILLLAKKSGALERVNGQLTIVKHLSVTGDVGVETGNIQFDGSVSIKGNVSSGYSVMASGDIEILDPEGVHNPKHIYSVAGDVFIRGGVFGSEGTLIQAGKDIYLKHANECTLKANQNVHVGFYSLGSFIEAQNVYVDISKGKIIGGRIEAKYAIHTASSGNHLERKTELIVTGLNRKTIQEEIKIKAIQLQKFQEEYDQLTAKKKQLESFLNQMNDQQKKQYKELSAMIQQKTDHAQLLDEEIKELLQLVRLDQPTEIQVTKEALPGTIIQIGEKSHALHKIKKGTFKLENGELNV